ncbi:unnamed protein product [Phaedon cochleariae]|uniref:Fanconi anemia group D2 protein n=1 Tax=Phaedon cochleariae TaxID=80249 RepID=A0A9P0DP34_PHACE|nr:unnamed protein product [Phaedon cochleariae]
MLKNSQNPQHYLTSTFKYELQELGIQLNLEDANVPHILYKEQALVVRDLEKHFNNDNDRIKGFLNGLKEMCKNEKYFHKALLLTNLKKENEESFSGRCGQIEQESLFRIFLRVNCLQKEVMNLLLNEMTIVSSESEEDTSWLHLLLSPLRYLSFLKDPDILTAKLTDILEVASYPAQLEILDSIPEIIPDNQYHETAKQLCKLLDEDDALIGAVIDCLNSLDLDADIRLEIHERILSRIASGTTLKIFPILLAFLLTDCNPQNCVQTLMKIRNTMETVMLSTDRSNEKDSCKILIFNKLQSFTLSTKTISESWLNMISNIKSHSDHKAIDYLILFMLHSTMIPKKKIIESMFRKRVHSGFFKISQMERMFDKYLPHQLLKDYFESIVEIGCSLLRSSNDQTITEFATSLFQILFSHEYTEIVNHREMLNSLMVLTGSNDKKTVSNVLKIISSFLDDSEKLRQHTSYLMRLLEKLDSLDLKDVKVVFEILCSLTCGPDAPDSLSGLKDEIHMIIRKQLYSSKKSIKHRGIISAVVMARNIVQIPKDTDFATPSPKGTIKSIMDLPRGPAKEAGALLELAITCTSGCSELMGLYYDQLASMLVANHHIDKLFMSWLYETVTANFQDKYIVSVLPQNEDHMHITAQYLLNSPTEMETIEMGVNIAGPVLKKNPSILLLAPHFRLVRLLHYRLQDGDLSSLDALLGCMVALPELNDIDDFDSDQMKEVADCLFHCANWFREVISGFVTKNKRYLRSKVIRRLEDLVDVEMKLQRCLEKVPDHKLPSSYFNDGTEHNKQPIPPSKNESKIRNPKKKLKTAETINELDDTATMTIRPSQGKRKKSSKVISAENVIQFRDLDTDIVLLLKYPLRTSDDCTQITTQSATLKIEHLNFLLKDLVSKLFVCTQNKDVGLSHLNEVIPLHLIKDASVHILPHLDMHIKAIVIKINKLLEDSDGILDAPEMFTTEALNEKTCFGLILEAFHLIFGWTGFHNSTNLEVLKLLLKSMKSTDQSQTLNSANKLITEFISRLSGYSSQCLELSQGVHLMKTMQSLYSLTTPDNDVQKKIVSISGKLLSKHWYNSKGVLDSGRSSILNIDILIKVYLSSASSKTIAGLIGTLQDQVKSLNAKDDSLMMLPSINKQNFHVFYNGLCSALLNRIKTEVQSLSNAQHLELWSTTSLSMHGLMTIAKAQETKTNLTCFLKKSIGILKVFLSHGIPILEMMLRSKPDEVVSIFKSMQSSTRFLHHLCCYTKFTKDASLMAYVPQFRLTLETLVYR